MSEPATIPTNFKTALPPRKRAKTKEEKEQRRIERILRNRKAAHASREKKRRHVEFLETYVNDIETELQLLKSLNGKLLEKFHTVGEDSIIDSLVEQVNLLPDLAQRKLEHTRSNSTEDDEEEEEEDIKIRKSKAEDQPASKRVKIEKSSSPQVFKSEEQYELPNTPESYQSPGSNHKFSRSNSVVSFNDMISSSESIKQEEEDFSFFVPSLERDENKFSLDFSTNYEGSSLASSPLEIPDMTLEPSTEFSLPINDEKLFIDQLQDEYTFDNEFVFDELRNPAVITLVCYFFAQSSIQIYKRDLCLILLCVNS